MRKLFSRTLLGLMVFASGLSIAAPSLQEVNAAVKAGQWVEAETMLHEVISSNPASAKSHYYLAQVLEREAQLPQAREELRLAEKIEPSLAFSGDKNKFKAFKTRLGAAAPAKAAEPVQSSTAPTRQVDASVYAKLAEPVYPSYLPSAPVKSEDTGVNIGVIMLVLLGIGCAAGGAMWLYRRQAKKKQGADAALALTKNRDTRKRLMDLKDAADKAILDMKLAGHEKTPVCLELIQEAGALLDDVSSLKLQPEESGISNRVYAREARIEKLLRLAQSGRTEAPRPEPEPQSTSAPIASAASSFTSDHVRTTQSGSAQPVYYNGPQTVVVDRSPDLLTTMLMVNAFSPSHHADHERIVERDVIREVPVTRYESSRSRDSEPDTGSSFDSISSGGWGGSDSSSSSSGSSSSSASSSSFDSSSSSEPSNW